MTAYVLVDGVAHLVRPLPLPPAGEATRPLGRAGEGVPSFRNPGTPSPGALARVSPLPQAGEGGTTATLARDGDTLWVHLAGTTYQLEYRNAVTHLAATAEPPGTLRAPMPGTVIAITATPGQHVKSGDSLVIIESMKLETVIRAPKDGEIAAIHYEIGARFDRDAVLVSLADPA